MGRTDVIIIGAGGHGRVVLDILRLVGRHAIAGFVDADASRQGAEVAGLKVLGAVNALVKLRKQGIAGAIVAIGDNRVRRSYAQHVKDAGMELISAVHPAAVMAASAKVGVNLVVAAGAVIGPEAVVGESVIINTNAVVDHECEVGDGAHICPGALLAGRVRVREGAFVGLGAKVLPCIEIGAYAVVGAGAVVLRDVAAEMTVVGVPARQVRG